MSLQNPDASHIYLNVNATNFKSGTLGLRWAEYSETRSTPILLDPSKYYISIVRFSIDTTLLPLMLVPIQTGQADVNLTVYQLRLRTATNTVVVTIKWVPEMTDQPTPASPSSGQDLQSLYYGLFSYAHFMDLVNTALADAATQLNALQPGLGLTTPYLRWNASSSMFSLICQNSLFDQSKGLEQVYLDLNEELWNLFMSFQWVKAPDGVWYNVVTRDDGSNVETDVLTQTQEFPNLNNWIGFNSLVITSPDLLTRQELISPSRTDTQSGNKSLSIITDFGIAAESPGYQIRQGVSYASTVYRLEDMLGTTPINSLTISVFWSDKGGRTFPLAMTSRGSLSLKIMFRLKSLGL